MLTIAVFQSILLLLQDYQLKHKHPSGLIKNFPPLQTMESLLFGFLWAGWLLLSLSLLSGALFLDDRPSYLCAHLWSRHNWPLHAEPVRRLCIQAIEERKTNRRYLVWLRERLEACVLT